MKAATIHQFGGPDVLQVEDMPVAKPKPGEVTVKVLAAGINRLDHYIRAGEIAPELPFPHVLGADAAGEVFELGRGVEGINVGDRVIVVPGYPTDGAEIDIRPTITAPSFALPGLHIGGTYAQYMTVPAYAVVPDRTGLTPEQAATLPVVLATAVHAVKGVGNVKAGDHVLVQAGASGSGSMHIQVAKALGAAVATTVRDPEKAAFARALGADLVIDVTADDLVDRVRDWTDGAGADVVIDNLGGDVLAQSIDAVKAEGVVVAYGFAASPNVTFDIRSLFFAQKQLRGSMASDLEDLQWGLDQVAAGRIKPQLDRALPLTDAAEAHRLVAANQVKGNIVLLPWVA